MTEAWFPAQVAPYFSLLSLTAIVSLLEAYARRGEHRAFVTLTYGATMLFGLAVLLTGIYAYAIGQPWHVWFTLGLTGGVIFPICTWALFNVRAIYRNAEMRRSVADDL